MNLNLPTLLLLTVLLSTGLQAQMESIPTNNPNLLFLYKPKDGASQKPAVIGAFDPKTKKAIWALPMGEATTVKIAASPTGDYLAVLSGDSRPDMALPAAPESQNTLYILNGQTGKVLLRTTPLTENPNTAWAEKSWQNLSLTFQGDGFTLSGQIFSNPSHPNPIPFTYKLPLSRIPKY